jgi:superfamily II DNA or RNA helicase
MQQIPAMLLVHRVGHAFREVIRRRGSAYARSGHVQIRERDDESARARVTGSRVYEVDVEAVADARGRVALGVSCSCPHFEGGEECKHIFATLCALDARGWQPAPMRIDRRKRIQVVRLGDDSGDTDPWLDDEPWRDEDADDSDESDLPLRPPARAAASGWRARLERLAAQPGSSALPGHGSELPRALAGAEAPPIYLIDPHAARREQVLRVYVARRAVLRDGGVGALRPARIGPLELDTAASAEESAALGQLLALAQSEQAQRGSSYGWYPSAPNAPVRTSSVAIPPAFLDPLLPRLAATGRLAVLSGWAAANSSASGPAATALRWLRLDPGAPWQLRVALCRATRGYELRGRLVRGDETLALDAPELVLAGGFLVHGGILARSDSLGSVHAFAELRRGPLRIPARELEAAIEELTTSPGLPPVELDPELGWSESPGTPAPRLRFAEIEARGRELRASLDFGYGDAWIAAAASAVRVSDRRARRLWARDPDAEERAFAALVELGFRATGAQHPTRGELGAPSAHDLAVERNAFEAVAEQLLAKGWVLEVEGARLRRAGSSWASVRTGVDYFDLSGGVDFDGERVPFPRLLEAARTGARFVRLGDGARGLLPRVWLERCARIASLAEPQADEALRFARGQLGFVDALLSAQDEARSDARFDELRRRLAEFRGIETPSQPPELRGRLRAYQREGLGWLRFLRSLGLGGCLADDMGLGKTLQVLALLAGREPGAQKRTRAARRPALVVAPKSVVHVWESEAARFTPTLSVLNYTGPDRAALRERLAQSDLVVTSYGTLRRDVAWLSEQRFDTVVLDEAQAIKNASARTACAARKLRADHRLALTGTPVENHLGELASLLDWLNPGCLGRAHGLKALSSGSPEPAAIELLARALRPILLRRTKEQVLRELPPKTEQTLRCELAPTQRREYDELRRHYQTSIAQRIERQGLARSKLHVLEALLRLRQAACHPALIDPRRADEHSAKLDLLFEQLDEVLDGGHKALIFSQFTRLLALVRKGLEARGIPHAYLDGRTRDRAACVGRFQQDRECRVFAISLKAGGTGLSLTAADYVFLLDPWWNPAVEAQAVDRSHRIGQTRPVVAYKLVAENTVEEKILELQACKRDLARSIFADEKGLIAKLTAEDLAALLG